MKRYAGRLTVLYVFLFRAVGGDAGGPRASIMGDDSVQLAFMLNTADHSLLKTTAEVVMSKENVST